MWYKYSMDAASKQSTPWVVWVLLASVVIILGQSLYKNYYAKDYLFYVEAACDSTASECYSRSCEVEGDCPPNNLSTYRVFELPASQFQYCTDNSCINICPSTEHSCTEISCSSQEDVACEGPTATTTTP